MQVLTTVFKGIAPGFLLIGSGIVAIYTVISIKNGTVEWLLLLIGAFLAIIGILMAGYIKRHEHSSWTEVFINLFIGN